MRFKSPSKVYVIKDEKKVNITARIRPSTKERLINAARLTPQKLPIAAFVEQIIEMYLEETDEPVGKRR